MVVVVVVVAKSFFLGPWTAPIPSARLRRGRYKAHQPCAKRGVACRSRSERRGSFDAPPILVAGAVGMCIVSFRNVVAVIDEGDFFGFCFSWKYYPSRAAGVK